MSDKDLAKLLLLNEQEIFNSRREDLELHNIELGTTLEKSALDTRALFEKVAKKFKKETAEYYKGRKSPLQAKEEPEQAKKEPVDAVINFTALEIVRSMTNYNLTEHQKEALQNNARIVIKNHLY